ncbi:calcium-dependent phosphotriesterase [Coemansia reversa NRRL 1564]|uniref:Calcium-dependent phosphotriesterase n=1 Tax=Coemansia reversa (strain ATCC 12441 / NRRL 1564) TaxID=763665 RepID=A0A2G5B808_COERN|nr:calcium-dependent phosphotriesterase [Coemansia reversa NRRL 1564]|eukprot:PIA14857.1 calcium-dependent phosphotriesterase [Coemansia reversa NRRL 1564]
MLQPNDLAFAPSSGRIFLSGMNYTSDSEIGDGDLWTCDSKGAAKSLGQFYRTNGIEVSPDEKTLYLSESQNKGGAVVSNRILAFDLDASSGAVENKRVFVDFGKLDKTADTDIDGMRTDKEGNLYVTRNGVGKIAVFTPAGELSAYISSPSIDFVASLEFGGPTGTDLYMVGKCKDDETKGCVDKFSATITGRAFADLQKKGSDSEVPKGCGKKNRRSSN